MWRPTVNNMEGETAVFRELKQKRAMQTHDPLFVLEPVIGLEPTTR